MIVWVVGRITEYREDGLRWTIEGVFDSEKKAVDVCEDDDWFVGSTELNKKLPSGIIDWPGSYYPLRRKKEGGMTEQDYINVSTWAHVCLMKQIAAQIVPKNCKAVDEEEHKTLYQILDRWETKVFESIAKPRGQTEKEVVEP